MSRRGNDCASEQEFPSRATLGGGTAGGAALIRSPLNNSRPFLTFTTSISSLLASIIQTQHWGEKKTGAGADVHADVLVQG